MTTISRRAALKLLGVSGAAVALQPSASFAVPAAPVAAKESWQGAGFYRLSVGEFELTVVNDGTFSFGAPFPLFGENVGKEKVEAALREAFLKTDEAFAYVNALLIRWDKNVLLVDTGCGTLFGATTGLLVKHLGRAGVLPKDITHIVSTHLHPDHFGGAFNEKGVPTFPNAKFLLHRLEHDFWAATHPDLSKAGVVEPMRQEIIKGAKLFLERAKGRIELYEGDQHALFPGITARLAAGHTPGHVMIDVRSKEQHFLYMTDLAHHHAILFPHPDWYVAYDGDRDLAAATRKKVFSEVVKERLLVSGAHLPFPALGHLRAEGDAARWVAADWKW